MRNWIKIVEEGLPENPEDDAIDWDNDWEEILEWGLDDTSLTREEQVRLALEAANAEPVNFRGVELPDNYFITDDKIIIVSTGYSASVEDKIEWLWNVNPEDFYPDFEDNWNNNYWRHPYELYHATTEENVKSILQHGIQTASNTRGITNRGVGHAVFTTSNYEEAFVGHYGDYIFEINMEAMATLPDRPYVSREPDVVTTELRNSLAHQIGADDFAAEAEGGMSDDTVIVYGDVPPQYLTLLDRD